ncbi:MAG: hypothetical protein ACREME_08570, partial [Gemmatimonadales bacterium]
RESDGLSQLGGGPVGEHYSRSEQKALDYHLRVQEAARAVDLPAVRAPRTWLLGVGWRRLGLLDPADVPG